MNSNTAKYIVIETVAKTQDINQEFKMPEEVRQRLEKRIQAAKENKKDKNPEEKAQYAQTLLLNKKVKAMRHNERVEMVMKNKTLNAEVIRRFELDRTLPECEDKELRYTQAYNNIV